MALGDLKKINVEEWKKQVRAETVAKMFSRVIWGIFLLFAAVFNFLQRFTGGIDAHAYFVFLLGVLFIAWGVFGFRREMKSFKSLE